MDLNQFVEMLLEHNGGLGARAMMGQAAEEIKRLQEENEQLREKVSWLMGLVGDGRTKLEPPA